MRLIRVKHVKFLGAVHKLRKTFYGKSYSNSSVNFIQPHLVPLSPSNFRKFLYFQNKRLFIQKYPLS